MIVAKWTCPVCKMDAFGGKAVSGGVCRLCKADDFDRQRDECNQAAIQLRQTDRGWADAYYAQETKP